MSAERRASVPRHPASCDCAGPDGCATWSRSEELTWLRTQLAVENEPVVAATHLLRYCRDHHGELWERASEPAATVAVTEALASLASALPGPTVAPTLSPAARAALAGAFDDAPDRVPPAVVAHGLATFLDDRYAGAFGTWFRRRSPYRPEFGDPIPLDDPGIARNAQVPVTSPPWRLANRLDETRHLRLAGGWTSEFDVAFDYSLTGHLAGLLQDKELLATCHPNRSLDEFALTARRGGRLFPVRPAKVRDQRSRLDALIGAAAHDGASVVVLPELSVTPALASRLRGWVERDDGPRLLVAGSYHVTSRRGGPTAGRHNVAVAWVRGCDEPIEHYKHSPADHPLLEDIQPESRPQLNIYVVDGWHLVVAICRDLLNPEAIHTLVSAGANLVLAPTMSETLLPFGGQLAQLVGSCQAVAAVANGPMEWPKLNGQRVTVAPALFGHPGAPQQTITVSTTDAETGYALLDLRTAEATWSPM